MAEKDVQQFARRMRNWEFRWVSIFFDWKENEEIKASVNNWLNDFEFEWTDGMKDLNSQFGNAGIRDIGGEGSIDKFPQIAGGQLADDRLAGRFQRNGLAISFRKELIKMYEDFDKIVEDGMGVPLKVKVEQFMLKHPTYRNAVHLVDKAGRKWLTGNYAAMYSRTRGAEFYTKTALQEMNELGMDVVQVSDISTTTAICSKYVGKFFSRTGQTPGLPVLDITPPFHPNCVHTLLSSREVNPAKLNRINRRLDKNFNAKTFTDKQDTSIDKQEEYIRLNRPNTFAETVAV